MKLEWIAAALNPGDIAPHPNFMSAETVEPTSMLALLAEFRWSDYERILEASTGGQSQPHYPVLRPGFSPNEMRVVRAVYDSLNAESVELGAPELAEIAAEADDLDAACRVAASLFASVALCELDDYATAIDLLERVLGRDDMSGFGAADARFLRSALLQQLALRLLESGREDRAPAQEALNLLESIRVTELSTFRTSKGVRWGSRHTLKQIVDELTSVSDAHVENLNADFGSRDWMRIVRAPVPRLSLRATRSAEAGLGRYLKESFDAFTGSTARTFDTGDPVEAGVYASLLHYELMGANPQVRARRSELGRLRVVRSGRADRSWAIRDAIRLFRHAEDRQGLDLALRHVRAAGPLASLQADAEQVVRNRVGSAPLRRAEMAVLMAAAQVLPERDAVAALEAVLNTISGGGLAGQRWEALSVRLEDAWTAAAQLAAPAQELDRVALELLAAVRTADPQDELLVRGLARAARALEWEAITSGTRRQWQAWLQRNEASRTRTFIDAVGLEIGVPGSALNRPPLERLAAVLNRFYTTGERPTEDEIGDAPTVVTQQLEAIRDRARQGTYGFGALAPADVAAGLVAAFGVTELWRPLLSFLLDTHVARADKRPALERLAREHPQGIPEDQLAELRSRIEEILSSPARDPFANEEDPFAAALRFAAAYNLISSEEVLVGVAKLGGSFGTSGRVEAARTLAVAGRALEVPLWTQALTLQLSHDADAVVRGEAGRALAAMATATGEFRDMLTLRILELLTEDGLLVPVLVLRGLREAEDFDRLPVSLLAEVIRLRDQHPARGIRIEAEALLQSQRKLAK